MTLQEKSKYGKAKDLKEIIYKTLFGKKFKLDCGHHVTFGCFLGNDVSIHQNGKTVNVICTQCGY